MTSFHNVFIPHRHEDDELVQELKHGLEARGAEVRDSSVTAEDPNDANNEDYIKSEILAPGIQNAGKIIVIITPDTRNHWWVDWEIDYANSFPDKLVIGVWAPGAEGCPVPEPLERHGHDVVPWDADKVVESMEGDTHWETPDGTPRPAPAMRRAPC
jgi:hypothetical protein